MVSVFALWLPILVSAVLVFVASSIIHMVLKYHANDYRPVPQEDALAGVLRPLEPGQYTLPYAGSMKAMGEPAFVEKMKRGPIALITVRRAGGAGMGPSLAAWFVFSIAVSIFAAYLAGRALGPGADYLAVFRFAGTTALIAYAVGGWQESIWYGRPWSTTIKNTIDGVIYAGITAGVFGWLLPAS
jgi:Flp pilus assembly protein TadB